MRDNYKFRRLVSVGEKLPSIRRCVRRLLKHPEDDKTYVLAAIVRLLDYTGLRIGNPTSAQESGTYGLSTLKNKHIKQSGKITELEFDGKGGVEIQREIKNSAVKDLLEDFYERPGDILFQYRKDRSFHPVSPAQINSFIADLSGIDMTAKEFRTWRSAALFVRFWLRSGGEDKSLKQLLEDVATFTGNTPATLRNSYIPPMLIEKNKDPNFSILDIAPYDKRGLRKPERYLMALMREFHS